MTPDHPIPQNEMPVHSTTEMMEKAETNEEEEKKRTSPETTALEQELSSIRQTVASQLERAQGKGAACQTEAAELSQRISNLLIEANPTQDTDLKKKWQGLENLRFEHKIALGAVDQLRNDLKDIKTAAESTIIPDLPADAPETLKQQVKEIQEMLRSISQLDIRLHKFRNKIDADVSTKEEQLSTQLSREQTRANVEFINALASETVAFREAKQKRLTEAQSELAAKQKELEQVGTGFERIGAFFSRGYKEKLQVKIAAIGRTVSRLEEEIRQMGSDIAAQSREHNQRLEAYFNDLKDVSYDPALGGKAVAENMLDHARKTTKAIVHTINQAERSVTASIQARRQRA